MMRCARLAALLGIAWPLAGTPPPAAPAPFSVTVGPIARLPVTMSPSLLRTSASAVDGLRVIVCAEGEETAGPTMEYTGARPWHRRTFAIYQTTDGGRTWRTAMRDTTSWWMSENSCAFGIDGTAYAAVSASNVHDGKTDHEAGVLHLWRSSDAGDTWRLVSRPSPFVDWSMLVVDTTRGPHRGNLYLFGNAVAAGRRERQQGEEVWVPTDTWDHAEGAFPLLTSQSGGVDFETRAFGGFDVWATRLTPPPPKVRWDAGAYPWAALVRRDGAVSAIYMDSRAKITERELPALAREIDPVRRTGMGLVESRNGGRTVDTVRRIPALPDALGYVDGSTIGFVEGAPDRTGATPLDVAYADIVGERPVVVLARTMNDGRDWSSTVLPIALPPDIGVPVDQRTFGISLARNRDGTLGLVWASAQTGCVGFAASVDDGKTWSAPTEIQSCRPVLTSRKVSLAMTVDAAGSFDVVWWAEDGSVEHPAPAMYSVRIGAAADRALRIP
jgi:hypothetical protein